MKIYIDRQKIKLSYSEGINKDGLIFVPMRDVERSIADTPAEDVVEVRHGHWVYNPDGQDWGRASWQCSVCGCNNYNLSTETKAEFLKIFAGSRYCPHCGTKMDKPADDRRRQSNG